MKRSRVNDGVGGGQLMLCADFCCSKSNFSVEIHNDAHLREGDGLIRSIFIHLAGKPLSQFKLNRWWA